MPSANGIKSRAPNSGPTLKPQKPPRSKSEKINIPTSPSHSFAKITTVVFLIAIADVLFVWQSINSTIGGDGNEPHHIGAEAGLHHLHEKKRMKQLNDHVMKENIKQGSSGSNNESQLRSNKAGAIQNQNQKRVNTNGDIVDRKTHKMKENTKKVSSDSNNGSQLQSNKVGASENQNQNRVTTVDAKGDDAERKTHQLDERIANILKSANVEVDEETASQLPTWATVVEMYGEEPIIYGLETCEPYRQSVKPEDRMTGPAGIFNTGTNLYFELMKNNCMIKEAALSSTHREPKRNGMRWQAPWGKHNPPSSHRFKNVAKMWGEGINHTAFFPVVTIKDPYGWMGSQCRHRYATFWEHGEGNCPNLIKKKILDRDVPEEVMVKFAKGYVNYDSLIDFWNTWYEEYEAQTFPMLHTRFEDLLFHGEEVTKIACECVGGVFTDKFSNKEGSAKENGMAIHKGANGLVKALIQYGDPSNRLKGLTDRDRWFASKSLNADLMRKYGYTAPPLPT
ncbi:hypothetical protein ACHAXR_003739 [Thalassiosira sp. AJA248-18]